MQINFEYAIGDIVRTRRGETGTIVGLTAVRGKTEPLFKTVKLELDDGSAQWVPEFRIEEVVGW